MIASNPLEFVREVFFVDSFWMVVLPPKLVPNKRAFAALSREDLYVSAAFSDEGNTAYFWKDYGCDGFSS